MQTIRDNAIRMLMEGYDKEQIRGFLEILSKMPECECDQLRINLRLEQAKVTDLKAKNGQLEELLDALRQGAPFTTRLIEQKMREVAELRAANPMRVIDCATGKTSIMPEPMDPETKVAYDWALGQEFRSVASRYAKQLALYIKKTWLVGFDPGAVEGSSSVTVAVTGEEP